MQLEPLVVLPPGRANVVGSLEHDRIEPGLLKACRAGQTGGAGADYYHIMRHYSEARKQKTDNSKQ